MTFKSSGALYPIQVNLLCESLHKLINDDLWTKALTLCRRIQVQICFEKQSIEHGHLLISMNRIQYCGPHWLPSHRRKINWKLLKKPIQLHCKLTKSSICNISRCKSSFEMEIFMKIVSKFQFHCFFSFSEFACKQLRANGRDVRDDGP